MGDLMDNDLTGFVTNIRDESQASFSFDFQTSPMQSSRIMCYTPGKRARVEENLRSPVKIKNIKLGKKLNFYNEDSEIEPTEEDLGFEPINYANLTIDKLQSVSRNALIDISVNVLKKEHSKQLNSKTVDTYSVSDPTGKIKSEMREKTLQGSIMALCHDLILNH